MSELKLSNQILVPKKRFMKTAFIFCCPFLFACEIYSIQNNYKESVWVGSILLKSKQCLEFFDLPLLGDFPIKFRDKNHQLISSKAYPPSHYIISEQGEIIKRNKACELEPVKKLKDDPKNPAQIKTSPPNAGDKTKGNETKDPLDVKIPPNQSSALKKKLVRTQPLWT